MDQLIQKVKGLKVYDIVHNEVAELAFFAGLKTVTDSDIVATDERYTRYLQNWTLDDVSYINEWIIAYLSSKSKSEKVNLMCVIDYELYNIVCKAVNS